MSVPRRLVPLAISALCLWAIMVRLDWVAAGAALAAAHWPLVGLGAVLTLVSLGLRGLRWQLLLGPTAPPLGSVLRDCAVGVAAGLVVPGSGEVARTLLLGRRGGMRTSFVLASVAVEKLLDTVTVLALFAAALWLSAGPAWLGRGALGAAGAALLAVCALLALAGWSPGGRLAAPRWMPSGMARTLERLGLAMAERRGRFRAGLATVARLGWPARAAVGGLTLLLWAMACLATLCALAAFALPADWRLAATLYGALLLGLSVPSTPGALGTFELVCVAVLDAWGIAHAPAVAFALGFHALAFGPLLLAGALAWTLGERGVALTPRPLSGEESADRSPTAPLPVASSVGARAALPLASRERALGGDVLPDRETPRE